MRRLLIMLALAGSFAHAAWARVSPIGTMRKSDPKPLAGRVVEFAEQQVGVPYRFGGISRRTGFDCSGLVYAAYRSIGRMIPHSSWGQMTMGTRVPFGALRPVTCSSPRAAATWCWWSRTGLRSRRRILARG